MPFRLRWGSDEPFLFLAQKRARPTRAPQYAAVDFLPLRAVGRGSASEQDATGIVARFQASAKTAQWC